MRRMKTFNGTVLVPAGHEIIDAHEHGMYHRGLTALVDVSMAG